MKKTDWMGYRKTRVSTKGTPGAFGKCKYKKDWWPTRAEAKRLIQGMIVFGGYTAENAYILRINPARLVNMRNDPKVHAFFKLRLCGK